MRGLPEVSCPALGPRTEAEPTRRTEQDLHLRLIDKGLRNRTPLYLVRYALDALYLRELGHRGKHILWCTFYGALVCAHPPGQGEIGMGETHFTPQHGQILGVACGVVGAALQAGAVHVAMLIIGRLVIGFAIGVLTMVVPIYQAEIAPPHARAFIMSVESIMTAFGYVIANWVGYGCSFTTTSFQWRFPLAVQVFFALLVLCAAPFLPESPRWLIEKGEYDHARELVRRLHAVGDNSEFLDREFQEMKDQIIFEKETMVRSYREAFSKPSWRRRIFLACGAWIGVSITGITVVNFYREPLIKFDVGWSRLLT